MIRKFTDEFVKNKAKVIDCFREEHPGAKELIKAVVTYCQPDGVTTYGYPDPDRITTIDDGDYQGTLVFVVPETGYQPYDYWVTTLGYGSCEGCDTLSAIQDYEYDKKPTEDQLNQYYDVALHLAQKLKSIYNETS